MPHGLSFNSLFVGGTRAVRARFPNGNPLNPGDGFTLTGSSLGCPKNNGGMKQLANNVEVVNTQTGAHLSAGPTTDGATRTVKLDSPAMERPTRQDFISFVNGTTDRFDHTFNGDYWGSNTIMGVRAVKGLEGAAAAAPWANASTGVVHMYHPQG